MFIMYQVLTPPIHVYVRVRGRRACVLGFHSDFFFGSDYILSIRTELYLHDAEASSFSFCQLPPLHDMAKCSWLIGRGMI